MLWLLGVLLILSAYIHKKYIPVLTGTKELRLGGAKFNCEAAVFSKLLITSLSPALVNTVEAFIVVVPH